MKKIKPKRTLVIGDIHGNLKALKSVLANAKFNVKEDRIICIGDYIDGWSQSFEVVRTLLEIQNQSPFDNIFLLGNHDKWFLDILTNDFDNLRDESYIQKKYQLWYIQGGKATYDSYLKYSDEFIKIHKQHFFNHLKYYHLEDNLLFVHAGFKEDLGFDQTFSTNKEELLWNRSLYHTSMQNFLVNENLARMNKPKLNISIGNFERIFIGHTPTSNDGKNHPLIMGNVVNIDQGCKTRGVLTAWVLETDTFFQNEHSQP